MSKKSVFGQIMHLLRGSKNQKPDVFNGVRQSNPPTAVTTNHELMKSLNTSPSLKSHMSPFLFSDAHVWSTLFRRFANKNNHPSFFHQVQAVTLKAGIDTEEKMQECLVKFYGIHGQLLQCHFIFQKKISNNTHLKDFPRTLQSPEPHGPDTPHSNMLSSKCSLHYQRCFQKLARIRAHQRGFEQLLVECYAQFVSDDLQDTKVHIIIQGVSSKRVFKWELVLSSYST